jgi:hypothetical protein
MSMPEEVPILTGKDFCRRSLHDGAGKHCMLGWSDEVFGVYKDYFFYIEAKKVTGFDKMSVASMNDNTANSLETLAKIWNRVMARWGYDANGAIRFRMASLMSDLIRNSRT